MWGKLGLETIIICFTVCQYRRTSWRILEATHSGHLCTVEFQHNAGQSWQSWAHNELNQAATYPSPYANVHKGDMSKIAQSIGFLPTDTRIPPNADKRKAGLDKLETFRMT